MDYKEKIQKLINGEMIDGIRASEIQIGVLKALFPEFTENEDERIRKEIINFLELPHPQFVGKRDHEKWITWLEKQGNLIVELQKTYVEIGRLVKENCYLKERQGEQKPVEWSGVDNAIVEGICLALEYSNESGETIEKYENWMHSIKDRILPLNEVLKQKPADKVEPKFKIGDWIIHNKNIELANSIMLVTDKDNNAYLCKDINGQCSYNIEFIDKDYHLWTIRDAQAGDVLEFGDHGRLVVGIVSYVNKTTGKVDVNCLLENNNFKVGNYYNLDTIKSHPATKEQRDTLFQKMKEAGYEWDAEKKELKKIEQKSAEWSEEDKTVLMKANEAPEKLYLLPNGLISFCRNTDNDIEYIRKDVFIEKASEWIETNVEYYMKADKSCCIPMCPQFSKIDFIEKFKKAMKEE